MNARNFLDAEFSDGPDAFANRETDLRFFLHGFEDLCLWSKFKMQRACIENQKNEGKDLRAVISLLDLAKEIELVKDEDFFEEDNKNLITELETVFYEGEDTDNGFVPPLVAFERNPYWLQTHETEVQFLGYSAKDEEGKEVFVNSLKYPAYLRKYHDSRRRLFRSAGPFFQLYKKINDYLDNRLEDLFSLIKEYISQVEDAIKFTKYSEFISFNKKDEMTEDEKRFITRENTFHSDPLEIMQQDLSKEKMSLLTNNPFETLRTFASLAINVKEIPVRFFQLCLAIGLIQLGIRSVIYEEKAKKKGKKEKTWFTISFQEEEQERFNAIYAAVIALVVVNEWLNEEVTITEKKLLRKAKIELHSILEQASGKLFALVVYVLGFDKAGYDFTGNLEREDSEYIKELQKLQEDSFEKISKMQAEADNS